jgi:hypothetical protein
VNVDDDAAGSDGHAGSMRGTPDHISQIRCSAVDGSITEVPARNAALIVSSI